MSRTSKLIQQLSLPNLQLRVLPANGDCLYIAIATALHGVGTQNHTVSSLRNLVSDTVDEETFQSFNIANSAGLTGYEFMSSTRTLEALKSRLIIKGTDANGKLCIWAEDFAIRTIVNALGITLCIFDEQARDTSSRFCAIRPEVEGDWEGVVVVQRSRRSHYNLICDGANTLIFAESIMRKFNLVNDCAPETKRRKTEKNR